MIKERVLSYRDNERNEYVAGSICEWGTKDNERLSEYDIHLMALNTFSKNVDVVFMATNDAEMTNRMKKLCFSRKGKAQIAFYDLRKEFREAKDINLWRVRLGYGDTIFS